MLDCNRFLDLLSENGVAFSTGVPDSLLKNLCACIADRGTDLIAANEGNAIALAAGHHLATGRIPFVYLQNSGFGNTLNPLTSLADPEVYALPMLVVIGWRGEPGVKDEPQHVKMGRINQALLNALELPWAVLSADPETAGEQIQTAFQTMKTTPAPYLLLVKADTFGPYSARKKFTGPFFGWNREEVLQNVLQRAPETAVFVSTTGKTSREVFEFRARNQQGHGSDFLTVGCMGHASSIAAGIALSRPERTVFCLDGDGAFLMHQGAAAIIADLKPANFYHILINNGSHESVGAQSTVGFRSDLYRMAQAAGYHRAARADSPAELEASWPVFTGGPGPALLEIRCDAGARENLGRPTRTPVQNKADFMEYLGAQA